MAVINIRATVRRDVALRFLTRMQALEQQGERIIATVAQQARASLVLRTPKKWTGITRRSWRVDKLGHMHWAVSNPTKVMWWLEHGTRAHGPVTAKLLFIPLNRKAMIAKSGGRYDGAGAVSQRWADKRLRSLVRGVDFILVKKVKGIRALKIAEAEAVHSNRVIVERLTLAVRRAVKP